MLRRVVNSGRITRSAFHPYQRDSHPMPPAAITRAIHIIMGEPRENLPGQPLLVQVTPNARRPDICNSKSAQIQVMPNLMRLLPPYSAIDSQQSTIDTLENARLVASNVYKEISDALRFMEGEGYEVELSKVVMNTWYSLSSRAQPDSEHYDSQPLDDLVREHLLVSSIAVLICIQLGKAASQFNEEMRISGLYQNELFEAFSVIHYFRDVMRVMSFFCRYCDVDVLCGPAVSDEEVAPNTVICMSPVGLLIAVNHPMAERALLELLNLGQYSSRIIGFKNAIDYHRSFRAIVAALIRSLQNRYHTQCSAKAVVEYGDMPAAADRSELLLHHPDYAILASKMDVPHQSVGRISWKIIEVLARQRLDMRNYQSLLQTLMYGSYSARDVFRTTETVNHLAGWFRVDKVEPLEFLSVSYSFLRTDGPASVERFDGKKLTQPLARSPLDNIHTFAALAQTLFSLVSLNPLCCAGSAAVVQYLNYMNSHLAFGWQPTLQSVFINVDDALEPRNGLELLVILYLNAGPKSPFILHGSHLHHRHPLQDCVKAAETMAAILYHARAYGKFAECAIHCYERLSPRSLRQVRNGLFFPRFFSTTQFVKGTSYCMYRHQEAWNFYCDRLVRLTKALALLIKEKPQLPYGEQNSFISSSLARLQPFDFSRDTYETRFGVKGLHPTSQHRGFVRRRLVRESGEQVVIEM